MPPVYLTDQQILLFQGASDQFVSTDIGISNFSERAYRYITQLVPNEFVAFGTLHIQEKTLDIGASRPLPRFEEAMYGLGETMGQHRLFNWDPTINQGKPFQRSDFYSEREFRQTGPYSQALKPLDVDNHCAVYVPAGNQEVSFFGIERKGGPDFSQTDRSLLTLAQTLLSSARKLALEREQLMSKVANPNALIRAGLTIREADVLTLVANGASNGDIAQALVISQETVKDHIRNIFAKARMTNRFAAALWALKATERDRTRSTIRHLPRTIVPVRF